MMESYTITIGELDEFIAKKKYEMELATKRYLKACMVREKYYDNQ